MFNDFWRKTTMLPLVATFGSFVGGCDGQQPPKTPETDPEVQELIGGFPAGHRQLDFVGALVAYDPSTPWQEPIAFCSGALVGAETVLTAKHCAEVLSWMGGYGYRPGFAIGGDSRAPARIVPIVDHQMAPGPNYGGFVGMGRDVAVVHLEAPITDIAPVVAKALTDDMVGQKLVAIGYGVMDNSGNSGERRVGAQTVKATKGRTFEALFGTFEAFLEWFISNGYYSNFVNDAALDHAPGTGGSGGGGRGGSGGTGGSAGGSPDGGVITDGGGAGGFDGGNYPWPSVEEIARQVWEGTLLLEGYEAVTGGAPGDAQACYGDSGSPLIRFNKKTKTYEAFGVVSGGVGSSRSICDFGAVYATFGPEVLPFVQTAAQWTDPCGDLNEQGACVENVASRCTSFDEGKRRVSSLDCDLVGLQCTADPQVSCGGTPLAPAPEPVVSSEVTPDFRSMARGKFAAGARK